MNLYDRLEAETRAEREAMRQIPLVRAAIDGHFRCTRQGGLVILFFPTPTWLYRAARAVVESVGAWPFPDERPLGFDEVLRAAGPHGRAVYQGVNWGAVFTQGMVVVEVGTSSPL